MAKDRITTMFVCMFVLTIGLASAVFSVPPAKSQTPDTDLPTYIHSDYVEYPYGQLAAKNNDKVTIRVNTTNPGASSQIDVTLITGSVKIDALYDDGDYAFHRDISANDGQYANSFKIYSQSGYRYVPYVIAGYYSSIIVGVDNIHPTVSNVAIKYPVGQKTAKQGDMVRVVAKVNDNVQRVPVDVVMVLDNSGSMDGVPIIQLVSAAKNFTDRFDGRDRLAIYCFKEGTTTYAIPRLLMDWTYMDSAGKTNAQNKIDSLLTDAKYATPIWDTMYDAIRKARTEHLPKSKPVVIAMTDGDNNVNNYGVNPLANWYDPPGPRGLLNVPLDVYTIGLTGTGFSTDTENTLKAIAYYSIGPGIYFRSPSPDQLAHIYETVSGLILGGVPEGIMYSYFNATAIGGLATEAMYDDGKHEDGLAGDGWYGSDLIPVRSQITAPIRIDVSGYDRALNNHTNYTMLEADNNPPFIENVMTHYVNSLVPAEDGSKVYFTVNAHDIGAVAGIDQLGVFIDASSIGGGASIVMRDDGTGNDNTAGDGEFTSETVTINTGMKTGIFTVTVSVHDNAHNIAYGSGKVEVFNANVKVAILTPFRGEFISGICTLRASVVDNHAVSKVSLEITGPSGFKEIVDSMTRDAASGEYRYTINTTAIADGQYTAKVTAVDVFSRATSSSPVTFHVDNTGPSVGLVSPTYDGTILEGKYTIKASVVDPSYLNTVQCRIDAKVWVNMSHTGGFYTYIWDTLHEQDGNHTLTVRAIDKAGHSAVKSLAVVVDNTAPSLSPVSLPEDKSPPYPAVKGDLPLSVGASDAVKLRAVTIRIGNGTETEMFSNATDTGNRGVYTYIIKTDNYPSEDVLAFTITAYDMLDHQTSLTRSVLVDRTAPTITEGSEISIGLKNGRIMIMVNVTDSGIGISSVGICIDNGQWLNMTKSDVYKDAWFYEWATGINDNGKHIIRISAKDLLGNEVQTSYIVRVQNYDNNHLVFLVATILFVILIIVPLALRPIPGKKKKSTQAKQQPPEFGSGQHQATRTQPQNIGHQRGGPHPNTNTQTNPIPNPRAAPQSLHIQQQNAARMRQIVQTNPRATREYPSPVSNMRQSGFVPSSADMQPHPIVMNIPRSIHGA